MANEKGMSWPEAALGIIITLAVLAFILTWAYTDQLEKARQYELQKLKCVEAAQPK